MPHDLRFHIRACAEAIIARNIRLAGLGIAIACLALVDDPSASLAVGGVLNLIACFALLTLAARSESRDCRRTEVWALLRDHIDLPPRTAQIVFAEILRASYLRAARLAAIAAAVFLAMSSLWYVSHHLSPEVAEAEHEPWTFSAAPRHFLTTHSVH